MQLTEEVQLLIDRAVAGDGAALQTLLKAHHDRLLRYIERQLPRDVVSYVDPLDVVQDTYFEACRLIGGFKPMGDDCLFRWLVTIARHRMIDLARVKKARPQSNLSGVNSDDSMVSLLEQLAVYRRTPSRSAAAHEFLACVERALQRLPEDYREVITLRHIQGLSVPEVAAQTGRTPDNIYVLCCRGLQALRADLQSASFFL